MVPCCQIYKRCQNSQTFSLCLGGCIGCCILSCIIASVTPHLRGTKCLDAIFLPYLDTGCSRALLETQLVAVLTQLSHVTAAGSSQLSAARWIAFSPVPRQLPGSQHRTRSRPRPRPRRRPGRCQNRRCRTSAGSAPRRTRIRTDRRS
jgi:hypothetical protein